MKRTRFFAFATLASIALFHDLAAAQELSVPQPNVMLLVDTSGSMEYETSSSDFPTCDPTSSDPGDNERSRWIGLVEVLSGTITDYRCQSMDRRSSAFRNEYEIDNADPADFQYQNPYHRPLSGTCAIGPGTLNTSNAFLWSEPQCHPYDNLNGACAATACESFRQSGDGIIDAYGSGVRFGLMTFDTLISEKRGYSGTSPQFSAGVEGAWSYYVGSPAEGKPANCAATSPYEVGGRNAAAPPWEGRMVAFGDPSPELSDHAARNAQIEKILLTTRPYGATPVAGLLSDALAFFTEDDSADPLNNSLKFGPKDDPYVAGGCRTQHVILLTDGEPNLDLRPYCTEDPGDGGIPGECPYSETHEIAAELYENGVIVHVIGFALDEVQIGGDTVNCSEVDTEVLLGADGTSGVCAGNLTNDKALGVCCELSTIAHRGSKGEYRAHFAGDTSALRKAFGDVLAEIAPRVSLTQPAVASGASASSEFAASMRFYSAARPESFSVWRAELERERYVCDNGEPKIQAIDVSKGDDFVENLHSNINDRRIITVEAEADSDDATKIYSGRSIRPHIVGSPADGLDSLDWTDNDEVQASPTALASEVDTRSLGLNMADPSCNDLTADACADQILNLLVGMNPTDDEHHRCRNSDECSLMGAILHSTPQVVGRPDALILDESYDAFKLTYATRPLVLYTSSNDGFLHAFKVAGGDPEVDDTDAERVETRAQNELWAFIPPAVLTGLQTQYPGSHQILLDGVPVIKDVVASPADVALFARDADSARFGTSLWRTVLVQSFGGTRGGYFALDITDPVIVGNTGGPRFLWQLTTDSDGNPLFGNGGGTPLITTVFLDDKEVAVAVLPGGEGTRDDGAEPVDREAVTTFVDSGYTPRAQVPAYSGTAARSLTVVRLDNGQIIRTFRNDADEVDDLDDSVVTETGIDSPITGTPVAYPSEVGAVADRVFVGDQDGALWRLDLSEASADEWTMTLFYDAFPEQTTSGALPEYEAEDGQPIATRPIISVDGSNRLVVLFSTGDQESMFASETDNFIVSLTEIVDTVDGEDIFKSKVNWYKRFDDGKRVTGNLVLFSGQLYAATFEGAPKTSVCGGGKSTIWAMDFLERATPNNPGSGGKPLWKINNIMVQEQPVLDDNEAETVVFGLTLTQEPSCIDTNAEALAEDPFIAFGSHTQLRDLNPGKFKLIMHTGGLNNRDITADTSGNTQSFDLATPSSIARVDSWAAIVE
ncbi:MAG TPA: hypothetical protein VI197_22990 [Polyangiaceae bacterium]